MPKKSIMPRNKAPPTKLSKLPERHDDRPSNDNVEKPKTASGLDQDSEDRFEVELCWCIQQLEASLSDKNLQEKQQFNAYKSLNILKSNNASLIKKRQLMRNTFGDYRSKMMEDEKKYASTATSVKFTENSKKIEKKSLFIKRAVGPTDAIEETEKLSEKVSKKALINPDVSNEPFKFNFSLAEE